MSKKIGEAIELRYSNGRGLLLLSIDESKQFNHRDWDAAMRLAHEEGYDTDIANLHPIETHSMTFYVFHRRSDAA